MEVDSRESNKATQCDLDGFHSENVPHINSYRCDYCDTLWMTQVHNFPLGTQVERFGGRKLCQMCLVEQQERLLRSNLCPDTWNKKCWLDCFVKYEDFYCCNCNGRNRELSVLTHPGEHFLVHSFIHFHPHKFCSSCFTKVFNQKAEILHPECCLLCKRGPLVNTPLRHEVPS